ncbi:hypothetical protein M9Y10_043368 [Tritrichomonas musculus]|uniref:Protein kinase domain-containing protein n=1 Tax=Tritrichomonas musculus TaxID=1915356 RepID=A0ABR2JZH1_9EUKA
MIPIHPLFDSFEVIGHGSAATVYKAVHLPTNITVALKSIYQNKDPHETGYIQREFSIHRSIDHPFITSYFGQYRSNEQQVMVLEFVRGETLLDIINKSGKINVHNTHRIFCQIVSAIKYLHTEKKIAHRDLKLENIMVNYQGNVKLLDFGFAHINLNALTTRCASIPYAAPEIFKGQEYTRAVDIWSLGVILYGMLSGKLPFGDSDIVSVSKSVLNDPPKYNIECIPEEARSLITGMLEPNPSKRFTINQVELNEWVQLKSFKNLIKQEFYRKAELLTIPPKQMLDFNVLNIMKKYSIDYSSIEPEKFEVDFNDSLMAYKIIKRSLVHSKFSQIYVKAITEPSGMTEPSDLLFSNTKLPTLHSCFKNDSPTQKRDPIFYLRNCNQKELEDANYQDEKLAKYQPISYTMKSLTRPNLINTPLRRHSNVNHTFVSKSPKILDYAKINIKLK